jgi:S-DNA-T family DNA segregation ATPase FtsK/SpoIIIE
MWSSKKNRGTNFPLDLLGDDNLAQALKDDVTPPYSFPVGKGAGGKYTFTNLQEFSHIVAAGQTGSGMAVFQDTMLVSLMYNNTPKQIKFILIDPKRVSLSPYKESPYLQLPWVTEPKKSESAIEWLLQEIQRRFEILAKAGASDIYDYNAKNKGKMHAILLVIDEVADLMVMNSAFYKKSFVKIMQKSRAVGVMSFIATHRSAEEVLPGIVRANAFVKIAFTLPTKEASEIIIDQQGAEKLNGKGDLLLSSLALNEHSAVRLQAPYISNENLTKVIKYTSQHSA